MREQAAANQMMLSLMGDKTPRAACSNLSEGGPFWEVRLGGR